MCLATYARDHLGSIKCMLQQRIIDVGKIRFMVEMSCSIHRLVCFPLKDKKKYFVEHFYNMYCV